MIYNFSINGTESKGTFEEFIAQFPFKITSDMREAIKAQLEATGQFSNSVGRTYHIYHTFH